MTNFLIWTIVLLVPASFFVYGKNPFDKNLSILKHDQYLTNRNHRKWSVCGISQIYFAVPQQFIEEQKIRKQKKKISS